MLKLVQKHLISNLTFLSLINQIKWQRGEISEWRSAAARMKQLHFREVLWISWREPFPGAGEWASERTRMKWNWVDFCSNKWAKVSPQALSYTSVTNVRDYYSVLASQRCVHLSFSERGTLSIGCFSIRSRNRWKTMYTHTPFVSHTSTSQLSRSSRQVALTVQSFPHRLNRFVKIYQMSKKEIELWRK